MKTQLLLVLVAALLVLFMGQATPALAYSYDIHFHGSDGYAYCDGMHLEIPSVGEPLKSYTIDGYQTGCLHNGLLGVVKGKKGVPKGTEYVTVPTQKEIYVIYANHKWAIYYLNASGYMTLFNSGTWAFGSPSAPQGKPSNAYNPSAVDSAAPAKVAAAAMTKDIGFYADGGTPYCDGLHLVTPSVGLHKRGTVDGYQIGCLNNPLMGFKTQINGKGNTYVVTLDYTGGGLWVQILVFANKTWIIYQSSGSQIVYVNSGIWKKGYPTASPTGASAGQVR